MLERFLRFRFFFFVATQENLPQDILSEIENLLQHIKIEDLRIALRRFIMRKLAKVEHANADEYLSYYLQDAGKLKLILLSDSDAEFMRVSLSCNE